MFRFVESIVIVSIFYQCHASSSPRKGMGVAIFKHALKCFLNLLEISFWYIKLGNCSNFLAVTGFCFWLFNANVLFIGFVCLHMLREMKSQHSVYRIRVLTHHKRNT